MPVFTGCVGDTSETVYYDTLDEMKAEIGYGLLYPETLPFEPTYSLISGYHYKRADTWDYYVSFRNRDLAMSSASQSDEAVRQIGEGSPVVVYIDIFAYEPEHRDSVIRKPRQNAADEYQLLIEETDGAIWEINGTAVPRKIEFGTEAVRYGMHNGINEEYAAYVYADAYAAFMHSGILYTVDMHIIGHINETREAILETADNMLETVVRGMLESMGEKPFKDLAVTDISSATVEIFPPNITFSVNDDGLQELADILNRSVIFDRDDSHAEMGGQAVIFTITKEDGTQIAISAFGDFIIINGVGYKSDTSGELSRFGIDLSPETE